jgi:hypothetical protein
VSRADAAEANMGLTGWSRDVVRKSDGMVARNYLHAGEIDALNRIVVMFLDFAENQANRRKQVFLGDWSSKLDDFLRFTDRPVLETAGTVSREAAEPHAAAQYEAFDDRRRLAREQEGEAELVERIEAANRTRPGRES